MEGTPLVVHWLRICLPMQGTWVWFQVEKIPHAMGQLSPVPQPLSPFLELLKPGYSKACALQQEKSLPWEAGALQLESSLSQIKKPTRCNQDPAEAPKIYKLNFKNFKENTAGIKNLGSLGNSLAVQWLGFYASTAGDPGSIPSWGTKILQAMQCQGGKQKFRFFKGSKCNTIQSSSFLLKILVCLLRYFMVVFSNRFKFWCIY